MTQDEKWRANWREVMDFIKANHRNPSKHRIKEHLMLNWVKHNRKLLNDGKMAPERVEMFGELVDLWEESKRKNQYQ